MTKVIETSTPASALASTLSSIPSGSVFILTDTTVEKLYLNQIAAAVPQAQCIVLPAGEEHKNLESLTKVWEFLSTHGGTRSSILINLGGGTITDLGGFAAATFKRGIRTINIPTTLLASADASLGGKTGINFCGLKNEIGAFHDPEAVILSSSFFRTLPDTEILSGWAEVVKMALITPGIPYTPQQIFDINPLDLDSDVSELLKIAVESKRDITTRDPHEHGIRAFLNLGHTAAHAFESLAMQRHTPIPHGIAVAHGILLALTLSDSAHLPAASPFVDTANPSVASPLVDTANPSATALLSDTANPSVASPLVDTVNPSATALLSDTANPSVASPLVDTVNPSATALLSDTANPSVASPLVDTVNPSATALLSDTANLPAASTLSGRDLAKSYSEFLKRTYPSLPFTKADAHHLAELMLHDKKNQTAGTIRFITLPTVGYPAITPFTLPQIEATLLPLLN